MKVSVEIITGTFLDPEVSDNATVRELKEKIAMEVKLPVKRLILVIEDDKYEEERRMVMENEDEMLLRDLGVRQDSHMYLFIKDLDLVSHEEGSQGGGGGDDVEEVSSQPNEQETKAKRDGENGDEKTMKNVVQDRNEKVEDEKEEMGKTGEEEEKDNDVEIGEKEAFEGEEGDKKEET